MHTKTHTKSDPSNRTSKVMYYTGFYYYSSRLAPWDGGSIRITCPCDLYPLTPHFYIYETWMYRGIHFLIFALDIEKRHNFSSENNIFTAVKYCCILHDRVCVMVLRVSTSSGCLGNYAFFIVVFSGPSINYHPSVYSCPHYLQVS